MPPTRRDPVPAHLTVQDLSQSIGCIAGGSTNSWYLSGQLCGGPFRSFCGRTVAIAADERAVAAHRLLESLHDEQPADEADVNAAWDEEIDRRVDDVLKGRVQLIDVEESRMRIRAELGARRK